MRSRLHRATNALLGSLGLRMVSAKWGPRGAIDALRRARAGGVEVRQVVDVGASNGSWTRECLPVFPDARYLLFEPLPAHRAALEALLAHGDQSSFLRSESFPDQHPQRVEVRTLDSFLGSPLLQAPDLIKADVQGFELEVLRGAKRCLDTAKLLLLEVSYRRIYENLTLAHEVIAHVGGAGFRIYDICTYSGRPRDGELTQSDILFAAEGSPLFANEDWC